MRKGITRRWMINGFTVIVIFLGLMEIVFGVAIHSYYYQSVENVLENRADLYRRTVSLSTAANNAQVDLKTQGREFVERFTEKEKIELQVLDKTGRALVSSTGFEPRQEEKAQDYVRALQSEDGKGVWWGRNENREKVMALTMLETDANGVVQGGLRYVVSLSLVDRQIWILTAVMLLFGLAIVFFVTLSSSYFISSIVNPVAEIGRAARRLYLPH